MAVDRVYDLGRVGESVAARLLASVRLGNHLEPVFVLARHPAVHGELRRRLQAATPLFARLKPGIDIAEQIADIAKRSGDSERRRHVLWIEQEEVDLERWKETLVIFNRRREWLQTNAPWLIVLAGPLVEGATNLNNLAGRHAPDFFSIAIALLVEEEPQLLAPPPSRSLHWLHLSDFHFAAFESWDRRGTLKALLELLGERTTTGWKPDFVFATGDIAWSGKEKDYDQASVFFRELAKVLDLDLPSQLFLIPGNHDVDRGAKGPADDFLLDGLLRSDGTAQQELIAKVLTDAASMRLLGRRLEQYYHFTERLLGPARRTQSDRPWRVDLRTVSGIEVAILQLNSAWASGRANEKGRLLVGAQQLEEALGEAEGAKLKFVLIHHPFDYLADGDAAAVKNRLANRGSGHFFLRGHLHATGVEQFSNPDGKWIELAAGAVYADTPSPKRFLIGKADLRKGKAAVEFFTYSNRGFWTVDSLAYRNAKKGRVVLDLPSDLKLERSAGDSGKKARRETAIARYRAAVAAVHGRMRFIGFPAAAAGNQPNVAVRELFVPLRLVVAGQGAESKKEELSTAELLALLAPGKEKVGRFVVLGEPGSGKTTLCRFAAVAFSGATGQPPGVEVLPLFLPFRDYVRQCRESGDCGLLEYLAGQARSHLQVAAADSALLDEALSRGAAVLLLDGLDEVGNELERAQMRERVLAFCQQYPRAPALLTSRHAGYDQAPLPADAFRRLDLKPFEDEDLRLFVVNWYAVQEPDDPVVRDRGIADLLAAFATEPRVRALAGNPLLATLIALVHRTEARLPGERAKLYEVCVRTLLETWPWQSRRRFAEIDEGLQRAYLEEFALRQQEGRSSSAAPEVIFERSTLVDSLAEIIAQVQTQTPNEVVRRLVERWVEYLAVGTGIIVEQRPGVFAFLHLSLLEYLSACALDRRLEPLPKRILRYRHSSVWWEVLLLEVGRHATDLKFLEDLYLELAQENAWYFLLLCLREEAAFDDGHRSKILHEVSLELLGMQHHNWINSESVVQNIERFSIRHGRQVHEWRMKRLREATGDELCAAVALSFGQMGEIQRVITNRQDRVRAAFDCLEFWPGSKFGNWVVEVIAGGDIPTEAIEGMPAELATVRMVACIVDNVHLSLSLAILRFQLLAVANYCQYGISAFRQFRETEHQLGIGLPIRVQAQPVNLQLEVVPRWLRTESRQIRSSLRRFAHAATLDFTRSYAMRAIGGLWDYSVSQFMSHFARNIAHYFSREFLLLDLELKPAELLDPLHIRKFTGEFVRDYARNFDLQFGWRFASIFRLEQSTLITLAENRPDYDQISEDRRLVNDYIAQPQSQTFESAQMAATTRTAAEAWIALMSSAGENSRDLAKVYRGHRLQNISLLYLWPAIDRVLLSDPDPDKLAVYLQLGWTQSTTTHEWPATERWISIMKAGPPAHWLPRAQWHLCWLLHDNQDAEHQRAFNEALREGLADTDIGRHAVAETLEQVIGFYP